MRKLLSLSFTIVLALSLPVDSLHAQTSKKEIREILKSLQIEKEIDVSIIFSQAVIHGKSEADFVYIEDISHKYDDIYLIRNERELKIFDKVGRAFEPDFLLFCKQNDGDRLYYQVFIEPKGTFLIANDKWKEDFLNEIRSEEKTITINTDDYLITAVPFYNYDNENEFKAILNEILKI